MVTPDKTLKPIYDFVSMEREIELKTGKAQVKIGEKTYEGNGRVVLKIVPRPSIQFKADIRNVSIETFMRCNLRETDITEFHFNGSSREGFSGGLSGSTSDETVQAVWHPSSEPIIGLEDESTKMTKIIFHLFNFEEFYSCNASSEKRNGEEIRISEISLQGSGLRVCIKSLFETHEHQKQLKRDGGMRLTHVGSIQKVDESSFNGQKALNYLTHLRYIVSFANGKRTFPVCAVGFNAENNRVWEEWSSPRLGSRSMNSWFNKHHCDQLENYFECYLRLAEDQIRGKAIRESIYWYLNANDDDRGIDAGIILTQAALELLAYTHIVVDKSLLSARGFKSLWASDKIRLFFSSVGIPISIPSPHFSPHA